MNSEPSCLKSCISFLCLCRYFAMIVHSYLYFSGVRFFAPLSYVGRNHGLLRCLMSTGEISASSRRDMSTRDGMARTTTGRIGFTIIFAIALSTHVLDFVYIRVKTYKAKIQNSYFICNRSSVATLKTKKVGPVQFPFWWPNGMYGQIDGRLVRDATNRTGISRWPF